MELGGSCGGRQIQRGGQEGGVPQLGVANVASPHHVEFMKILMSVVMTALMCCVVVMVCWAVEGCCDLEHLATQAAGWFIGSWIGQRIGRKL